MGSPCSNRSVLPVSSNSPKSFNRLLTGLMASRGTRRINKQHRFVSFLLSPSYGQIEFGEFCEWGKRHFKFPQMYKGRIPLLQNSTIYAGAVHVHEMSNLVESSDG